MNEMLLLMKLSWVAARSFARALIKMGFLSLARMFARYDEKPCFFMFSGGFRQFFPKHICWLYILFSEKYLKASKIHVYNIH